MRETEENKVETHFCMPPRPHILAEAKISCTQGLSTNLKEGFSRGSHLLVYSLRWSVVDLPSLEIPCDIKGCPCFSFTLSHFPAFSEHLACVHKSMTVLTDSEKCGGSSLFHGAFEQPILPLVCMCPFSVHECNHFFLI